MKGYVIANLVDFLSLYEESNVKTMLSSFSCPYNNDVEEFIKYKAIEFSKQDLAKTFLVFYSHKEIPVCVGYFTISIKSFTIKKNKVSEKKFKRLKKFGIYDKELKQCVISAPLIAQLSKNYNNDYNELITGDDLLKMACDKVREAQSIIGGKIVYLECEDKPKLIEFYNKNGFYEFDKRYLDKDEKSTTKEEYYIQMIRYFENVELWYIMNYIKLYIK